MDTYHINEIFTEGEVCVILRALTNLLDTSISEETYNFAASAHNKIIAAIE